MAEIENKNEVISALNQILKGEHMAIELYNDFIEQIENNETKDLLQKFQQEHKDHATTLSTRIQNLGGLPNESSGLSGIIPNTMMEIGNLLGIKPEKKEIIKKIYNGEQKGLQKVEEIQHEKLDQESKSIVDNLIATDHNHLKEIEELLNSQ